MAYSAMAPTVAFIAMAVARPASPPPFCKGRSGGVWIIPISASPTHGTEAGVRARRRAWEGS
ncbi:hypothetical protein PAE0139 [Pyrobaculum aerophilum str. IM2]|uniref:Uncharacterized protein n=1 Tax=Pyrobaculum aerophilum (strain ATCC 51768 / DSM 7523 / JCM 9630 / CIP 104966 / NBRC 100827 / IM2) TaxID=178306 RepID=Q8ZZQ1_PYRAE|nr:hypothetical protein PAE0139 [Pyrobaculum aerophilum str. IM2]